MKPLDQKRGLVLAAMVLVTAWSLWAFAQNKRQPLQHEHAGAAHSAMVRAAPSAHPAPPPPHTEAKPAPGESKERDAKKERDSTKDHDAKNERDAKNEHDAKKEEVESEEPRPINWTDFGAKTPPYIAMVINFAILVAGYYLLGKKPIMAALQSRRDSIAKEIEQATRMKQEAEGRAKTYQAKLEKLEDEVRLARDGLVRAGEAERDRIIAEAEAKAERMRKDAEFLAVQELKQVRQDLLRDTVEAAVLAAQDLLMKRVTPGDQERLAEDYLADLAGRMTAPGRTTRTGGEPS